MPDVVKVAVSSTKFSGRQIHLTVVNIYVYKFVDISSTLWENAEVAKVALKSGASVIQCMQILLPHLLI